MVAEALPPTNWCASVRRVAVSSKQIAHEKTAMRYALHREWDHSVTALDRQEPTPKMSALGHPQDGVTPLKQRTGRSTPNSWTRKMLDNFHIEGRDTTPLKGIAFSALQNEVLPDRFVILERNGEPLFREGQLIQVFAERGLGKTWFTRTLALIMACRASAMEFTSPCAHRVLYLDGEMASREIQQRDQTLASFMTFKNDPVLVTIAADWQDDPMPRLDTEEGKDAVEPYVEWADVVIVDNRACLCNAAGERDPNDWQDAQRWILDLRRRGKLVILVHHTGKTGDSQRGISNVEDVLDFSVELVRPDEGYEVGQGARFTMKFTKTRGVHGAVVEPATFALTPNGWVIESSGSSVTTLQRKILDTVASGTFSTKTAIQKAVGGNTRRFYDAFDTLEDKDVLRQRSERASGYSGKVKGGTVWEVNLEIAKKFGYSHGSN